MLLENEENKCSVEKALLDRQIFEAGVGSIYKELKESNGGKDYNSCIAGSGVKNLDHCFRFL